MDLDQTVMAAGIGCRSGVTAEEVEAALAAALRQNAPPGINLTLIATAAAKRDEAALTAVARARGVPLRFIHQAALEAANTRTLTRSKHSMAAMNVHSVAEAAALAGADAATPITRETTAIVATEAVAAPPDVAHLSRPPRATRSRLLGPRIVLGPVTCALAIAQAEAT